MENIGEELFKQIAHGDKDHREWLKKEIDTFFDNRKGKTLDNTTADQASKQVSDIKFWGNGDTFKLISKASSKNEGWMKSTKAMEIIGYGVVLQVSTQQWDKVAEAITFIPGAKIVETTNNGVVVSRVILKS